MRLINQTCWNENENHGKCGGISSVKILIYMIWRIRVPTASTSEPGLGDSETAFCILPQKFISALEALALASGWKIHSELSRQKEWDVLISFKNTTAHTLRWYYFGLNSSIFIATVLSSLTVSFPTLLGKYFEVLHGEAKIGGIEWF